MRVVALEEHFTVPHLVARMAPEDIAARGFRGRVVSPTGTNPLELLPEIGPRRIGYMDEAGITLQVISNSGPGPDLVVGAEGVAIAREMNDYLAEAIARYPDRLKGFAVLPMQSPEVCAQELRRCVKDLGFLGVNINGTTQGRFLDHPAYAELLAEAVALDVPVYLHPHLAPAAVREAYYMELPAGASRVLEAAGWGWHQETGLHVLRLVLSGALDRNRGLRIVIGHMGEMLPMMMARAEDVFALDIGHLQRSVSRTITDHVWVTTSGVFTQPPFLAAMLTFGIDRLMFSVDYPYASNMKGRQFLDRLSLAPDDMAKLCHGNADRLLKLA